MGRSIKNIAIVLASLLWLVPSYLLVVNAFTAGAEYTGTPSWWFTSWSFLDNVGTAFSSADVGQGMVNSLLYAGFGALLAVAVAALASFALAVMPAKRPALWFWLIYVGTILPLQTFLAPLFTSYATASLYDTQYGMLLVYVALAVPFAFFVTRNYMTTIPHEMREAATLDGAGWLRIFLSIHLPLARSAMLAAFLFQFTWIWNDMLFGITLSTSPNVRPVMASLAGLTNSYASVGPPVVLAGALVASVPTLLLFFVFQRYFIRSLTLTS